MLSNPSKTWLALIIGNSRLHWGLFNQNNLIKAWDSNYLPSPHPPIPPSPPLPLSPSSSLPLFIASVVPTQTKLWENHPNTKFITLNEILLNNLYPTLGIDRALALLGAGESLGFPMLVIDAGTALTFTGADSNRNLIGGAILPGLGLQFSTLTNKTGQLPNVELPKQLPQRFAVNTSEAIQSGIIYTILAGIKDFIEAWLQDFPESKITITGGDRNLLFSYLKSQYPQIAAKIVVEKNLILRGIQKTIIRL
ncbi:MAG: pantothenate kinase [Cyanobacteria bacterium P01_A01_bin.68]